MFLCRVVLCAAVRLLLRVAHASWQFLPPLSQPRSLRHARRRMHDGGRRGAWSCARAVPQTMVWAGGQSRRAADSTVAAVATLSCFPQQRCIFSGFVHPVPPLVCCACCNNVCVCVCVLGDCVVARMQALCGQTHLVRQLRKAPPNGYQARAGGAMGTASAPRHVYQLDCVGNAAQPPRCPPPQLYVPPPVCVCGGFWVFMLGLSHVRVVLPLVPVAPVCAQLHVAATQATKAKACRGLRSMPELEIFCLAIMAQLLVRVGAPACARVRLLV